MTALGVGLWLSALNALYRDVRYVVPFLVQFWMFASPVAYPSSLVPEKWRWLYGLNPMAGVIEGFRWALTGHGAASRHFAGGIVRSGGAAGLKRAGVLPRNGRNDRRRGLIDERYCHFRAEGWESAIGSARSPVRRTIGERLTHVLNAPARWLTFEGWKRVRRASRISGRCATCPSNCARARCWD